MYLSGLENTRILYPVHNIPHNQGITGREVEEKKKPQIQKLENRLTIVENELKDLRGVRSELKELQDQYNEHIAKIKVAVHEKDKDN